MKKIFIGFIAFIFACGESTSVDTMKLDASYFVGDYEADYRNEIEKITLKANGYYDYSYGKNNDTIIIDAGKWSFIKDEISPSITIYNLPLLRKNRIYMDVDRKDKIHFDVDASVGYLGDLFTIVGKDEDRYTFIKLDKSRNKDYILKK